MSFSVVVKHNNISWENRPQLSQVLEDVCLAGAKTAKTRAAAGHVKWQPAAVPDRRRGNAGEDCNGWDLGSSLSAGIKAGFEKWWQHSF